MAKNLEIKKGKFFIKAKEMRTSVINKENYIWLAAEKMTGRAERYTLLKKEMLPELQYIMTSYQEAGTKPFPHHRPSQSR